MSERRAGWLGGAPIGWEVYGTNPRLGLVGKNMARAWQEAWQEG